MPVVNLSVETVLHNNCSDDIGFFVSVFVCFGVRSGCGCAFGTIIPTLKSLTNDRIVKYKKNINTIIT